MSRLISRTSVLLAFVSCSAFAQSYIVSTIAGGAPAATPTVPLSVAIGAPRRVAVDGSGNVYFTTQNAVYKIGSGGMTRIAGDLRSGYSGDGGSATAALLNQPYGVAVDASGRVFVADTGNNAVRVIANGIINTYAGNGTPGYTGDFGTPAYAQLNSPVGLAIAKSGILYIADTGNSVIRAVTADGVTITTLSGSGFAAFAGDGYDARSAKLAHPYDVAVDGSNNIFIADTGNGVIRKIKASDATIETVAGNGTARNGDGGLATSAVVTSPYSVTVDGQGNIYIGEYNTGRIRQVDSKGNINTFAGTGSPGFSNDGGDPKKAQIATPYGLCVDSSNNIYLADLLNYRIRKISGSAINTIAGSGLYSYSGDGASALGAQLNLPTGIATDTFGNVFFSDQGNNRVRMVSGADGSIATVAGTGTTGSGGDGGAATSAQLNAPYGLTTDGSGALYIADSTNGRVRKVSGTQISSLATSLAQPSAVAVAKDGTIYYATYQDSRVRKIRTDGTTVLVAGDGYNGYTGDNGPSAQAELWGPTGLAVDGSGNLYIADSGNNVIRKVDTNGVITTVAGYGLPGFEGDGGPAVWARLAAPTAVAVDAANNLFIIDGNRIRLVTTDGNIQTVAGTGNAGYTGDGGTALNATFNGPSGLAVDLSGNLYIADSLNNAVRKLAIVR